MANTADREAFIEEAYAPLVKITDDQGCPPAEHPVWLEVALKIKTEGPALGRTARWLKACAWFDRATNDDPLDWVVTQGGVWLVNAS